MKDRVFLLGLVFLNPPLWAAAPVCVPREDVTIDAEARCVDNAGIGINSAEEDVKAACLKDKKVEAECGPKGELTRGKAYRAWLKKLQHFEDACSVDQGSFYFKDTDFKEPQNESFCHDPIPEVGTNMFEEALCNYKSTCPGVEVICDRSCP